MACEGQSLKVTVVFFISFMKNISISKKMIKQLRNLRWVGTAEGISFLLLLLVAMPLKYYFGWPLVVKYVGWMHGFLFMVYVAMVLASIRAMNWSFVRVVLALAASVVPLGPFFLDTSILKRLNELQQGEPG